MNQTRCRSSATICRSPCCTASARCCGWSCWATSSLSRIGRRLPHVRPRGGTARLAHGGAAGDAGHRRRGAVGDDLLAIAARRAGPDLAGVPGGVRHRLQRRPARQPARRHRRVRYRHAARAEAATFRRRSWSAPSWCTGSTITSFPCSWQARCLPATKSRCAAAPCCAASACPRGIRWSDPELAVTSATGAVALCGVLMLLLGVLSPETAYSWLNPDYADDRLPGGPVRAFVDRRGSGGGGVGPVATGEPGLGLHPGAAAVRHRLSPPRRTAAAGSPQSWG